MSEAQMAMTQLLEEADRRAHEIRDLHRGRVHAWFESLSAADKFALGTWMSEKEWDTCCSLSNAACDWYRHNLNGAVK